MKEILKRMIRLTLFAASGPQVWIGLTLYAIVLGLEFLAVYISLYSIAWNKDFYDALEKVDASAAMVQIGIFAILVAMTAGNYLIGNWLRSTLLMRWRERLTTQALDRWTANKAYWHLRPGLSPDAVDNPDQRIAEDCRRFVDLLLEYTLEIISSAVALVSYVALLWTLSNFPLSFTAFGTAIEIPHYMVWLALAYVALSTGITHLLGRPLKNRLFNQERREADFRHALIQIREAATEIAQAGGEAAERRRLAARFEAIKTNWRRLINAEFRLGLFTRPYFQTVLRIPTFLALPAYLAGAVTLGGLMQLAQAFSSVTTTLSLVIFKYRGLAEFVAVSERLEGLFRATETPTPMPNAPRNVQRGRSSDGSLRLTGLRLSTPDGRALHPVPDSVIQPGRHVWISGASGQGKTTLLTALSGLWPYGIGRIDLPTDQMMFLPQMPHVFEGGIAVAACYPADPAEIDPDLLRATLLRVGLGERLAGLDDPTIPLQGLSMGERQRLALARVLILKPSWVVLDEATSALDASAEANLLGLIRSALPHSTILCVAHRAPQALAPFDVLNLGMQPESERENRLT